MNRDEALQWLLTHIRAWPSAENNYPAPTGWYWKLIGGHDIVLFERYYFESPIYKYQFSAEQSKMNNRFANNGQSFKSMMRELLSIGK